MKMVFCVLIFLFPVMAMAISNDVVLEKLNTINSSIIEIKDSFKAEKIAKDNQIENLNNDVVDIRLCQASTDSKINIIWGIFGTAFGGGIVGGGVLIQKKRNGKTNGDKTEQF